MKEREKIVATGLTLLMLILWLGFVFHRSPRFAGSAIGGILAVSGALLMLVPLAYMIIKRNKRLKKWVTQFVSMRTMLAWHIYAGIVGPILVLVHTGHKFESVLGIALTTLTIIVVISGFVGRYLMQQFSTEIREKKAMLAQLESAYLREASVLHEHPDRIETLKPFTGFGTRLIASFFVHESTQSAQGQDYLETDPAAAIRLSESIADVEYAIKSHEKFKTWFGNWLKFHIWIAMILYVLMALHVWAAIHFGLRWFESNNASHFASSTQTADFDGAHNFSSLSSSTRLPSSSGRSTRNSVPTAPADNADAVGTFSKHFAELFRNYWRPAVTIHGISTTVFDYAGIAKEATRPDSDFSKADNALKHVNESLFRGDDFEKAYWINVYNFAAMKMAAVHYPIPSIVDPKIDADDPWGVPAVQIGNSSYSLKQIENSILLKTFNDPRVVFGISCAAVSCPDRGNKIFSGDRLDEQLDAMLSDLFSNPEKGLAINRTKKQITLTWIMKADRRLFGGTEQGMLQFITKYVSREDAQWIEQNAADIEILHFEHDWALNDIALADGSD